MSSCTDYQEKASLILDGELLPSEELAEVEQHVSVCAACNLDHSLDLATRAILRQRFPIVETPAQVRLSIQNFLSQQIVV
jgi:anti-sigma factor RsiW